MIQDIWLEQLAQTIAGNWGLVIENQELIIRSAQPMWIEFYNIAGIPFNDPGLEKFTPEYLQKNGKKIFAEWRFKLEPKWSLEQTEMVKKQNQKIYEVIQNLPTKHGIAHLKRSYRWHEELFWNANEQEKKLVELYKIEKENLLKTIIRTPDYNSEKYSLFSLDKNWSLGEKAGHLQPMIYPKSEEEKIYILMNLFNN